MLEKITIPPIPIIVHTDRIYEDELDNLSSFITINKAVMRKVKYPLNNMNFIAKIGNTEYEVSTKFDISGNQTLLEQFQKLILSQN